MPEKRNEKQKKTTQRFGFYVGDIRQILSNILSLEIVESAM